MICQRMLNSSIAENFIRSAKAPAMRAGVMIAKVIWKVMSTVSGIVPDMLSRPTPVRKNIFSPPVNDWRFNCPAAMPVVSKAML